MQLLKTARELKLEGFTEIREILEKMINETDDFEVEDYRFINTDNIDEIMKEELSGDEYMLGCFTPWFISDITGLDIDVVEKAQKSESYELLGALMLKEIDKVQSEYVSADGYGHYFNHYDGGEIELCSPIKYHAFRIN